MSPLLAWLNENAGSIQAIATVVQVGVTMILVIVTRYYARETNRIANQTEALAGATGQLSESTKQMAATKESVEHAQRQYRDATLPVIVYNLLPWPGVSSDTPFPMPHAFLLELYNAGSGQP